MSSKLACIAPDHHVHGADAFVHAVEHACAERGLRLTPIRTRVLRLIAEAASRSRPTSCWIWSVLPRAWAPTHRRRCTGRWIS